MKKFEIEVTVPEGMTAGDTFTVEVEMPAVEKKIKAKVKTLDVQTSEKITKKIYGQVSEKHA